MKDKRQKMAYNVEIENVLAVHEKGKGLLVEIDGDEETVWIPKSLISSDSEVYEKGTSGTLIIPEWLAEEKGLI